MSRPRGPRDDRGDTLVEVLVSVLIVGLTSVSLLGAFLISIAGSAEHRNLTTSDTLLRSFASRALYQIQLQPSPTFTSCATPSTYNIVMAYPGNASTGSLIQVYGSGFTTGQPVGISIGGLSVTSDITKGATVGANGAVAATIALPSSGISVGTDTVTVSDGSSTGSGTVVITSDPAVTTVSSNYSIHISSITYWNGTSFQPSHAVCVAGGGQAPQLLTAITTTPRGVTDQLSWVVTNPGCVSSTSPAFASATSTNFGVGQQGSFTVRACGTLPITLSESGALPTGVSFSDSGGGVGHLAGTPAAGTSGAYPITFTAQGTGPDATQHFMLTVGSPPTITSAASRTAAVGNVFGFTVTTTGFPVPVLTEAGSLPSGLSFLDNGNGTATLSGTPGAGTGGTYVLTIAASNGISPSASQSFTLTVNQSPVITSAASATFAEGAAGSFMVTTSGSPTATITRSGALPVGVTFTDNGNGTATLAGTPAVGSGGPYPITFTAANGIAPAGSQSFTLSVQGPPNFTSAASYTATTGTAFTFTITTSGIPAATITRTGSGLPAGVTFSNNGNGTATLSGTPGAGTGGSYGFTLTASNGFSPSASQSFTLVVHQPPAFTSAATTTFAQGSAGSFTISTTGSPTASIAKTAGSLPNGVTLVDNGNGTAKLSGTPAAGTNGSYAITLTASNGALPNATQSFTLKVTASPKITSANHFNAQANVSFSFTVAASGYPIPTISIAGALPSGVNYIDNGNGTGTLSGKPKKGTSGSVTVTFTASNGISPNDVQSFTFTWS